MKTFTIENETNNITIHASAREAEAVPDSERFGNEAALTKLAVNWPSNRLVEIWNGLPGATPVQKFKNRRRRGSDLEGHSEPRGCTECGIGCDTNARLRAPGGFREEQGCAGQKDARNLRGKGKPRGPQNRRCP